MRLSDFDVYRKVPKDFSEGTKVGAVVSFVTIFVIVVLFVSELMAFVNVEIVSEMIVDDQVRGGTRMRVDMNITVQGIPCVIVSVDAQDVMGTHTVDMAGGLKKRRLSAQGADLGFLEGREIRYEYNNQRQEVNKDDMEWLKGMQGEGCRLEGYLTVNKVPGNVHISAHTTQAIFPHIGLYDPFDLDIRHDIHHFSMDNTRLRSEEMLNDLAKTRSLKGSFTPLDGYKLTKTGKGQFSEYYLKVVPTTYVDPADDSELYTFQITADNNLIVTQHQLPAIYFRYDFSPITVRYFQKKETFLHFLVQISAIVGGVFTVAGMIDGAIYRSSNFFKKVELGKQG